MIVLLHGDNIGASRNELNRLKNEAKGKEARILDGKSLDLATLTQALQSSSLFGGDTLVIIENLFAKLGRKTKSMEEFISIITKSAKETDVIVWEEKEIGTSTIKNLGTSAQVKLFKLPVLIFQFLDSFRPGNAQALLGLSQPLLSTEPAEVVFFMLVRRFRQLIMLKDNVTPEGLQPWQAARLTSQAKLFTMEKLASMYRKLLDIEYSLKTGATPFTLAQLTEQFLIDL